MPPPPWIESEFGQKTAIAVLMAVVFAGTVALAQWVTVSGGVHHDVLEPLDVATGVTSQHQIRLQAPAGWEHDPAADSVFAQRLGLDATAIFTDPQRPERQLLLAQMHLHAVTAPQVVAQRSLQTLAHPSVRGAFRQLDVLPISQPPVTGVWMRVLSPVDRQAAIQLHDVAALTADGRNYSLIYLTDRVSDPADLEPRLAANMKLVASLLGAIRVEESG